MVLRGWPGSIIDPVTRPPAIGRVFFVHGSNGDDAYNGVDPGTPFKTIKHALEQCLDDRNDYIYVLDCYQQETFPISITVQKVHIIGVYSAPDGSWPLMVPTGNTAVFEIPSVMGGYEAIEIAGFSLGAGADHACIELGGANNMTWIHHCTFGQYWSGGGQDGIRVNAGSNFNVIIEDCWFYGSNGPNGKLSRCGIRTEAACSIGQCTIRNNIFVMLPTAALYIHGNAVHEIIIVANRIACGANAEGAGINLGPNALGCWLDDNHANFGDTAMGQNPFLDQAPAGQNHWGLNYKGNSVTYPA